MKDEVFEFVKERFFKKFPHETYDNFIRYVDMYERMHPFKANQNIHELATDYNDDTIQSKEDEYLDKNSHVLEDYFDENGSFNPKIHWIMRMTTQYYLTEAFKAMKINLDDPNLKELSLGKGTPGRIAKV